MDDIHEKINKNCEKHFFFYSYVHTYGLFIYYATNTQ